MYRYESFTDIYDRLIHFRNTQNVIKTGRTVLYFIARVPLIKKPRRNAAASTVERN